MLLCIGVEFIKKNYLGAFDIFTKYNELIIFSLIFSFGHTSVNKFLLQSLFLFSSQSFPFS